MANRKLRRWVNWRKIAISLITTAAAAIVGALCYQEWPGTAARNAIVRRKLPNGPNPQTRSPDKAGKVKSMSYYTPAHAITDAKNATGE